MDCEICGEWGVRIKLAGDVPVTLCAVCARRWGRVCEDMPEFDAFTATDTRCRAAMAALQGGATHPYGIEPSAQERVVMLEAEHRRARSALRRAAEDWLQDQIAEHEANTGQKEPENEV